jgi:hypothetical protein
VIYLFKVYLLVIGVVLVTTLIGAAATAIARVLLTTGRQATEYLSQAFSRNPNIQMGGNETCSLDFSRRVWQFYGSWER